MTKSTGRQILNTLVVLVVLVIAGSKSGCKPQPATSPLANPTEITGSQQAYREMCISAVAPTPGGCSNGQIVVTASDGILMRAINSPASGPYDAPFPAIPSGGALGAWDNQLVRLANGDLLLLWQATTTAPLSLSPNQVLPSWWNNWAAKTKWDDPNDNSSALVENPEVKKFLDDNGARNGFRSAHFLWRFSASECKWTSPMVMDSGKLTGTKSDGANAAAYCAQLAPKLAGFDRPELYADPWGVDPNDPTKTKQRVYVSTLCGRCLNAPCPVLAGQALDDDSVQVFMSPDSGATWQTGMRLDAPQPAAMTSTPPNGRLFMMNALGAGETDAGARIYWMDPNGDTSGAVQGPFDITYMPTNPDTNENLKDPVTGKDLRIVPDFLPGSALGVANALAMTLSLARTGNNAVLAVYPATETLGSTFTPLAPAPKRQVAVVVWVVSKGKNDPPLVVPLKIIRAQDPKGSVFFANFIEDDRKDAKSATSMLYWIETTSQPAAGAEVGIIARYVIFTNGIFPGQETLLSDPAGWKAKNQNPLADLGDYMKGGFYYHNGTLNFVAGWPQVGSAGTPPVPDNSKVQAYARIITLADPSPPPQQVKPEDMPGVKQAISPTKARGVLKNPSEHLLRRPPLKKERGKP